jgi:hypothetical protein
LLIPATQETEIGGLQIKANSGKKKKKLVRCYFKRKKNEAEARHGSSHL